jgi:hypothetical protein|tara:strand:- start:1940 stop:2905 length:966 start_codon:yes stop_codon:yes gene_type:complete
MGLPVTVYRSTDVGAPQINGSVGSLLNVIQKCLVDGYGSKVGLGWVRAFNNESTGKCIYRNKISDGGSGGVVTFYALNNDLTTTNHTVIFQTAKDATDINTLFHPVPFLSRVVSTTGLKWSIIGTTRGFYLTLHETSTNNLHPSSNYRQWTIFFGDMEPIFNNDAGIFTMVTGNSVSSDITDLSYPYGVGGSTIMSCEVYDTDGFNSKTTYRFDIPSYVYSNAGGTYANAEPIENNMTMTFSRPIFSHVNKISYDRNGTRVFLSQITPSVRFELPGMLISQTGCYDSFVGFPKVVNFNELPYERLRAYYGSVYWIDLTEWY